MTIKISPQKHGYDVIPISAAVLIPNMQAIKLTDVDCIASLNRNAIIKSYLQHKGTDYSQRLGY